MKKVRVFLYTLILKNIKKLLRTSSELIWFLVLLKTRISIVN